MSKLEWFIGFSKDWEREEKCLGKRLYSYDLGQACQWSGMWLAFHVLLLCTWIWWFNLCNTLRYCRLELTIGMNKNLRLWSLTNPNKRTFDYTWTVGLVKRYPSGRPCRCLNNMRIDQFESFMLGNEKSKLHLSQTTTYDWHLFGWDVIWIVHYWALMIRWNNSHAMPFGTLGTYFIWMAQHI